MCSWHCNSACSCPFVRIFQPWATDGNRIGVLSLPLSLSISLSLGFERFKLWLHAGNYIHPPTESTDKPFLEGWPCRSRSFDFDADSKIWDLSSCWWCCLRFWSVSQVGNAVTLTLFLSIYIFVFEVCLTRVCKEIIQRSQGDLGAINSQNQTPAHICASAALVAMICERDTSLFRFWFKTPQISDVHQLNIVYFVEL